MTTTETIPAKHFDGLDIQQGDTLHVLAVSDSAVVVEVRRRDATNGRSAGKASAWLRTAKGSVQMLPGETVDAARTAHLREKHGLGV